MVLILSVVILPCSAQAASFTDVSSSSWYYDAVCHVTEKGLFQGTGNGQFSPDAPMNRGMFVTVMGRMGGADPDEITSSGTVTGNEVNFRAEASTSSTSYGLLYSGDKVAVLGTNSDGTWYHIFCQGKKGYVSADYLTLKGFSDIASGSYYEDYVTWAAAMKIVSGYDDNTFRPDTYITRQDMCVVLYRYANTMGIEIPVNNANANFSDNADIAEWARPAVQALHQAGVVNGNNGSFLPKNSSTRAEVAQMIKNFDQICVNKEEKPPVQNPDPGTFDGVLVDCEGALNLREGPGTDYAVITTIPSGAIAKLLGQEGEWYYVTYNGYTGYLHSDYCTLVEYTEPSDNPSQLRQDIIAYARTLLGVPYVWGGTSTDGFDCSGFVQYVHTHFNISIPRVAEQQYNSSRQISKSELKMGDLVFFSSSSSTSIEHVGIYIGASDGYSDAFIHASSGAGEIIISSLSQEYYTTYYYGCGTYIND